MHDELKNKYKSRISDFNSQLQAVKKHLHTISFLRLISFFGIIAPFFCQQIFGQTIAILISGASLILFLFLIKRYIWKDKQMHFLENLVAINEKEIRSIEHKWTDFDPGDEFKKPDHPFSYDLDVFGEGSLFQYLNRTSTTEGRKKLASFLENPLTDPAKIIQRQKALEELKDLLDWRQQFLAILQTEASEKNNIIFLNQPISPVFNGRNQKSIKLLVTILPLATIIALVLFVLNIMPYQILSATILTQWILLGSKIKKINRFYLQIGQQSELLSNYTDMLRMIETQNFRSTDLKELQNKLKDEQRTASEITRDLQKHMHEFEYRQNMFVGIILNSLFLWDWRCAFFLQNWFEKYHLQVLQWFDILAEIDALISLANYGYNHNNHALPEPSETEIINAKNVGHPLLDPKKRIDNNFSISNPGQLILITGANMAGKSTFLRTIGINLVLARNGCRVCAREFKFSPVALFTNMRTTDNLLKDESYFYAELLRLHTMLELLRSGKPFFVILDEMLKGTNSEDKLYGSKELIKQLIRLGASGIIATHDLKLTELAAEYPDKIKNQCFEVNLQNNNLQFDYLLREGVTRTMNATFLMKRMGIIE